MQYETYPPHPDLETIVKCYWTLEVPKQEHTQRQLILPDGCVDMCFILGDDIKRYTTERDFILQPRAMLLGQITDQFYIEPTGYVNTFAVRFYPYGFANLVDVPLSDLSNRETPLSVLFGAVKAGELSQEMIEAGDTAQRIALVERFLLERLCDGNTIDHIVKSTVDMMLSTKGSLSINVILENDASRRRQLERRFRQQVGMSPKQLSKVIRLQAILQMLLNQTAGSLTAVAYEGAYYDQAHFIRDFKEFTGITPKDFLAEEQLALSALLYRKD